MAEEDGEAEPESKSNSSDMAFDLVELLVAVSTEGMSLRIACYLVLAFALCFWLC